jgi:hypothetical protein
MGEAVIIKLYHKKNLWAKQHICKGFDGLWQQGI